jgi:hypothetical protein
MWKVVAARVGRGLARRRQSCSARVFRCVCMTRCVCACPSLSNPQAFWMPSLTPEAEAKPERPEGDTRCPTTGKKLRLKASRGPI